jgi:hypothetical protein
MVSFRGAAEGCEPGTHEHRPLEYGLFAAALRPGMTNFLRDATAD